MSKEKYVFEVDRVDFISADDDLDGRQVRSLSGHDPAANYRLIQIHDRYTASVGLEDPVSLEKGVKLVFRTFAGDRDWAFTVEDRGWEWGASEISESDVRAIGKIADDREIVIDKVGGGEVVVPRGGTIDLSGKTVERIYSRVVSGPRAIIIIVEGTEHEWTKNQISYAEVVTLEVPDYAQHPEITYSVTYKKGPGSKPEGTLVLGAKVKVKDGMVFYVSETGQS